MFSSDELARKAAVFIKLESPRDILRLIKLPLLLALEGAKLLMMVNCGCEVNELNNWMTVAIHSPYFWRTAADGTRFVAGPYSPIWYLLNQPARLGYWGWMSYLFLLDIVFSTFIFSQHGWKYLMPYMAGSIYFFAVDPIDFFIFQFALLGVYSLKWSLFAVVLKLPWLPPFTPFYVWDFLLHNPYGLNEQGGWFRYGQLGLAFTLSILLYIHRRSKRPVQPMRSQDLKFQV